MKLLLLAVASLFFLLAGHHEHVRYQHAYTDCLTQRTVDQDLLNRDVCFVYEDRLRFQSTVDCDGAERRLRVSVVTCALQHWFLDSNVAHLYHRLTGSFWALFATVMTPLLVGMYLWNSHRTQLALVDKIGALSSSFQTSSRKIGQRQKNKSLTAVSYRE